MSYFLGALNMKYLFFNPLEIEYQLRLRAKDYSLLGQEIRNLYRFYYADEPFVKPMEKQC